MRNLFITIALICFAALGVSAQICSYGDCANAPIAVSVRSSAQKQYTTFAVPLVIKNNYIPNIKSYQYILRFDPTKITPASPNFGCDVTDTLSQNFAVVCNEMPAGTLRVVVYSGYGFTGSGTLMRLRFTAIGQGMSPLQFVRAFVHEADPASWWYGGYVDVQ